MFRPGRILQFGGKSNGALVIDITRRHAGRDADAIDVDSAPARQRSDIAERQGARDRRQPGQQPAHWREQLSRNLGSDDRHMDARSRWGSARACITRCQCCCPTPACWSAAAVHPDRMANLNMEIYNPPYLYDAPVHARPAAPYLCARTDGHRRDVLRRLHRCGGHQSRDDGQDGSVTHSWNMEQRFVELTFVRSGSRLRVQAPTRAADAPPGFWMMFAERGRRAFARRAS